MGAGPRWAGESHNTTAPRRDCVAAPWPGPGSDEYPRSLDEWKKLGRCTQPHRPVTCLPQPRTGVGRFAGTEGPSLSPKSRASRTDESRLRGRSVSICGSGACLLPRKGSGVREPGWPRVPPQGGVRDSRAPTPSLWAGRGGGRSHLTRAPAWSPQTQEPRWVGLPFLPTSGSVWGTLSATGGVCAVAAVATLG